MNRRESDKVVIPTIVRKMLNSGYREQFLKMENERRKMLRETVS